MYKIETLLLIAVAGLAAQLVDGGLGMGFGATSSTMLIVLAGITPAWTLDDVRGFIDTYSADVIAKAPQG